MDITKLSLEQLKALAFDEIIKKDTAQNNLNVIQAEMHKRASILPESNAKSKSKAKG